MPVPWAPQLWPGGVRGVHPFSDHHLRLRTLASCTPCQPCARGLCDRGRRLAAPVGAADPEMRVSDVLQLRASIAGIPKYLGHRRRSDALAVSFP